jgi:hypothetical protein
MDNEKELTDTLKTLVGNMQQVYTQNLKHQEQLENEKKKNLIATLIIGFLAGILIVAIVTGYVYSYKQFDRMATAFENQTISVENSYSVPANNNINMNNANANANTDSKSSK